MHLLNKLPHSACLILFLYSCSTVEFTESSLTPTSSLNTQDKGYFSLYQEQLLELSKEDVAISVLPNVPLNQDFRFRKCYKFLTPDEPILAIVNSTISFNLKSEGCFGAVFTNKGIHSNPSKLSMVQGKHFIPYEVLLSSMTAYSSEGQGIIVNDRGYIDLDPDTDKNKLVQSLLSASYKFQTNDFIPYVIKTQDYEVDRMPDELIDIINSLKTTNLYSSPQIPWNFESRFRDCTGLHGSGNLLLFFPSTDIYKPGCYGAGFTDSGLYISNNWGADFPGIYFLPYDFLFSTNFNPRLNLHNNSITILPGLEFDLEGVSTKQNKPVYDFFNILSSFAQISVTNVQEVEAVTLAIASQKPKTISAFSELNSYSNSTNAAENKYKAIGNIFALTIFQSARANKIKKSKINKNVPISLKLKQKEMLDAKKN